MDCDCGNSGIGKYFGTVGGQFGDRLDNMGRNLATKARKKFKSFTGLGDYKIVSNSLIDGSGIPSAAVKHGNGIRYTYREYLGDITTHPTTVGAFHISKYELNPANVKTFPWGSSIALNFDQYVPLGIVFEFRSTASDNTTNASVGSIIMATEYDVLDDDYTSKADMLQSAYSSEAKMSDDLLHGIECDPTELQRTVFYTRIFGAANKTGDSARDYSLGNFFVATQGGNLPAGQSIGSLYVHYEFMMLKEQIFSGIVNFNKIYCIWDQYITPERSVYIDQLAAIWNISTTTAPYSTPAVTGGRSMGIYLSPLTKNTFVIPRMWQGAVLKLSISYQNKGVLWGPQTGDPIKFNLTGMTAYQPNTVTADNYWGSSTVASCYTGAVAAISDQVNWARVVWETYVKLDDIMLVDGTMTMPTNSSVHPFPLAFTATGTQSTRIMFEVYPNKFDTPF